ncbi:hypothetical protein Tco_1033901, partial [Tanacetum coccineum]
MSTRPSYSPGSSRSAQNLGKAECSNCKFLAEKIKTLEAKIKILEGALEMERHPEKHTLESAAILHELYNDMRKLVLEQGNHKTRLEVDATYAQLNKRFPELGWLMLGLLSRIADVGFVGALADAGCLWYRIC